ncbi:hypothetical protein HAX54_012277 [Datura stramonium]|uniref:Uncharacterized protein n=1 Tax=Datura stramonium TaxID=4076 RepID=A0ABS8S0V6_DATST|nr:hypothetical protein [Datura stramonium]
MGKRGGLFRYADGVDKLLMFLGTIGCIGDGLMTPLNMFILSALIDDYGGADDDDSSFTNDIVDKEYIQNKQKGTRKACRSGKAASGSEESRSSHPPPPAEVRTDTDANHHLQSSKLQRRSISSTRL